MKYGFEADFSLIPDYGHRIQFENFLLLNDNIDMELQTNDSMTVYRDVPIKLGFALGMFCMGGVFRVRVNLKEYEMREGQYMLMPQGVVIDHMEFSPDFEFLQLGFADVDISLLVNSDMITSYRKGTMNQTVLLTPSRDARKNFYQTYNLMRDVVLCSLDINKRAILGGYIYSMGHWLFSEIAAHEARRKTVTRSRNAEVLYQFIENVSSYYQKHRDVAFYADMAHLSPKYFGQIILKASGRKPSEWIGDQVILDAKAMLLSGKYSVLQVSEMLNFPNSSFFAKYFKEHVGCAPGRFSFEFQGKA